MAKVLQEFDPAEDAPRAVTAKIFDYPRNAWYVAAWDHELSARQPLARTIAGVPMTLGRTDDGLAVAGRFALPTPRRPVDVGEPAYPVVERHRFVWVWPGDPALADVELVPDMHQMDSAEWAGDGRTIEVGCNYQLVLDNLVFGIDTTAHVMSGSGD